MQVDRLLSNTGISVWQLFWVPYVLGQRSEALVALDWTNFEADDQTTLVASLITQHGRPTPLVWLSVQKSTLKGLRNEVGFQYVVRFRQWLTVTSDKGERRTAADWVPKAGHLRKLPQALGTADCAQVGAVVCVKKKGMKEPWCLATSLHLASAAEKAGREVRAMLEHLGLPTAGMSLAPAQELTQAAWC